MTLFAVPAGDEAASGRFEQPEVSAASSGQARARREGSEFDELAYSYLEHAGGRILDVHVRLGARTRSAVVVDAVARGGNGQLWWVLAHGNVDVDTTALKPGLRRTDTIRKAGFSAAVLAQRPDALPVVVLTSHLPRRTAADQAARASLTEAGAFVFDVLSIHDLRSFQRLRGHLHGPLPARRGQPTEWVDGPRAQQLDLTTIDGWGDA
jgi:hypothetical protein